MTKYPSKGRGQLTWPVF